MFPKTSRRASIKFCYGLFFPIFLWTHCSNDWPLFYSHYAIRDTRRIVYSARALLPRDVVLLGKWYSARVCLFAR